MPTRVNDLSSPLPPNVDATPIGPEAGLAALPKSLSTTPELTRVPSLVAGVADKNPFAKVGALLQQELKKAVYADHDFKLFSIDGDKKAVGLRAQLQLVSADDPLITGDPLRLALTESILAQHHKPAWAQVGYGLYPQAGFSIPLPLGPGMASGTIGFSADGELTVHELICHPLELSSSFELLKELTVDLPLDSAKAKLMQPGCEVSISGRGTIGAHAGIGVGKELAALSDFIGAPSASSGLTAGSSGTGSLSVRIKRLADQKVQVWLTKKQSQEEHLTADAGVGLSGKLSEWANMKLEGGGSITDAELKVWSWELDLADAAAAQAYDDLVRLDARAADRLLHDGSPAVHSANQAEHSHTDELHLDAHAGPLELLHAVSSKQDRDGVLHTAEGDTHYHRVAVDAGLGGLLSNRWLGARDVRRELVEVQPPNGALERYYHLSYSKKGDQQTSAEDLRKLAVLAEGLGVGNAETQKLLGSSDARQGYGKSDTQLEVFFTKEGLAAIIDPAAEAPLGTAFAEAYQALEQPQRLRAAEYGADKVWPVAPWLRTDHPKHPVVMGLLAVGPDLVGSAYQQTYGAITGRDLKADSQAWQAWNGLKATLAAVRAEPDPHAAMTVMAKKDRQLGLGFERQLLALAKIAGPERVIVQLAFSDDQGHQLALQRGSLIADPQVAIDKGLDHPV